MVACDGVRSPVRGMAGLEAEFDPLPEAELGFMSSAVADTSFAMDYLSDGGHIGMLSWNEGSAGWRSVEQAWAPRQALAPGLEAIKEMWARLLPAAESAVRRADLARPGPLLRASACCAARSGGCPGVVVIGDAAHFFGPETGISSGIGLGDAHALAEAHRSRTPSDPDAACRSYELWRTPAVRPYEAMDPGRQRMIVAGSMPARDDERWPPPG